MPTAGDMKQFLGGQTFGSTKIPNADLSGKTMVVTGSNTGLGLECAKHLTKLNLSKLILACRNVKKGEAAKASILEQTGCQGRTTIEVWEIDQANYASVLAFGQRIRSELSRLDGFIANAGVEMSHFELAEGLEMTLVVNVISTMLLAMAVLPKLKESSNKYGGPTTLTIVGSMVHCLGKDAQLETTTPNKDTFKMLSEPKTADMENRYSMSKLILHQCCAELAQRVSSKEVVLNWVNPGWCASELSRHRVQSAPERVIFALIGRTSEQGSRTLVHAVLAREKTHGCYLSECQIKPQSAFMRSERGLLIQRRLWKELVARIGQISPEIARSVQ